MAIRVILLLLSLIVLCFARESDISLFRNFVARHQKSYSAEEYATRLEIFKANLQYIEEENAKNPNLKLGLTQFADLTNDEFRAIRKGKIANSALPRKAITSNKAIPSTFNWVNQGVVGPVENLGQCGSSYIYSIVESTSSIYAITANKSYEALAIDQVTSCLGSGCNGGTSTQVLSYIETYGLEFSDTYVNGTCPKGKVTNGVCVASAECTPKGDENALAAALIAQGPIFIGIDASSSSFQLYSGGVYQSTDCNPNELDDSLLLVGYNDQAWIAQNNWGVSWGIEGYIWIARNKDNMCGVASDACYPTGVVKC